jgi:hypothetical protein
LSHFEDMLYGLHIRIAVAHHYFSMCFRLAGHGALRSLPDIPSWRSSHRDLPVVVIL